MCAAVMLPGRLFATSFHSTVPAASSVTWKTARPRAEFDFGHVVVSWSVSSTATNVVGAGCSAIAVPAIAPNARIPLVNAMPSLRMLIPPLLVGLSPYAHATQADQTSHRLLRSSLKISAVAHVPSRLARAP